jgi:ribose/xylose/arabinose/galactoside ABC-type transport system permease subunit
MANPDMSAQGSATPRSPETDREPRAIPGSGSAAGRRAGGWRFLFSENLVLVLVVVYFFALWPFTPGLGSPENLRNIFSNMLPLLIVAIGQTFVLISAGIDLSVTSIIALASVLGAFVMSGDGGLLQGSAWAVPLGISAMLGTGLATGFLNGIFVTRFQMPPFIVTLAAMMFFSGFAIWLTQSKNIYNLPSSFSSIGKQLWLSLPLTAAVAGVASFVLSRSLFGRWLYAVGHNTKAAVVSGVPVGRVVLFAYVISGLSAAIASILYTGRLETASPVLGQRILLDVIGATVIGGTSLYGGKGRISWTVFGVLFFTLIDNSLNLLGRSHFEIMIIKGAVILVAATLDSFRNRLV